MEMTIEKFICEDGDSWYSVVENGDVSTGIMHDTEAEAAAEMVELAA